MTATTDIEAGEHVVMDDLLWTVDRETPTPGVYRLLLARPTMTWPAGQVGFGHVDRLTRPTFPCTCCGGRGQWEDHRKRVGCMACNATGRVAALCCAGCGLPFLPSDSRVWKGTEVRHAEEVQA